MKHIYKQARKDHKILIKKTKYDYFNNKLTIATNRSRMAWKIINNQINHKPKQENIIFQFNGDIENSPQIQADKFNLFFKEVPKKIILNQNILKCRL